MTIDIPEDVARQLEELAERDDADIADLLRDLLARYGQECDAKQKRWATGADFAKNAKAAGLASPEPVDTSARSREILNTEFANYLKRRANR
ncbi:MAG: hypothetical protein OXI34_11665 [Chloroflexota bacterium]|nr:hypothetical protein [Chloroflexota bacterium]MDE2947650.1 hypothetical protein [Chloroflexota bacterium]